MYLVIVEEQTSEYQPAYDSRDPGGWYPCTKTSVQEFKDEALLKAFLLRQKDLTKLKVYQAKLLTVQTQVSLNIT